MTDTRALRAIAALREPDLSLAQVPNTIRQSIAEVIEDQQTAINWQPIETAPKDGTRILACGLRDGKPVVDVTWWRQPKDNAHYVGWGEFNTHYWPPTHWMPIPELPYGRKAK